MPNSLPAIGMRNIKTAVAVLLSLLFYEFTPRADPLYACLAAIMCVQPTVGSSFEAGLNRVIGTLVGGITGCIFLIISQNYFNGTAYNLGIAIGVLLTIYMCKLIKKPDATSLACVMIVMLALDGKGEMDAIIYTLNRIIDTTVGIVIAVLVNKYFNKPDWNIFNKAKKNSTPDQIVTQESKSDAPLEIPNTQQAPPADEN